MITCDDLRPMLAGYVDGQLSALEAEVVAAHLEQCGRCRQTLRDQQQVQYVLDADRPPEVADDRWEEIGKRLRAELEGTGERIVLKTRSRIETLLTSPPPALQDVEPAPPARPTEPPSPAAPLPPTTFKSPAVRPAARLRLGEARLRRGKARFVWVAHAIGALAAALLIALGLAPLLLQGPSSTVVQAPAIEPDTLARRNDVVIMEVQTMAPNYNVILYAGDAADVAAVWVVPTDS